jgi:flagellar hook-associated protein 2
MSSSSISPASLTQGFSGVSKYASSLQSVLQRAEAIAALPLQSLNNGLNDLNSKQSAVQGLDTSFLSLQQSISSLDNTLKTGILNSSISDAGIVSASISTGATAGSYSIEVTSLGSYSTALSNPGSTVVSKPSSQGLTSDTSLSLTVGTSTTTITPASTSLSDLVAAINSQAGDKVQATAVNVGSTSAPDYRLSLRAVKLGTDDIDISGSAGSLVSTSTTGTLASYKLNGLATPITSDSRTATLSPGVTVTLLSQSPAGQATTIGVVNNPSAVSSSLGSFVSAYNASVDAIAQYHGQGGGVLQGDSLLQTLNGILEKLGTYTNGNPSSSLAGYGVTLDKTGHLSIDSSAFRTAANANFSALLSTLGSSTTTGFLKTATDLISGAEDATVGFVKAEETDITNAITRQKTHISDQQASLTALQASLTARIAKADSTLANLESKITYVIGLFATYTGTSSNNQGNGLPTL